MPLSASDFDQRVKNCRWALGFACDGMEYLHGKSVLDVGAGYGAMAIACERAGISEYLGVEPWPFGASVARLDGKEYGARVHYERLMPIDRRDHFCFFEGYIEKLKGFDEHFDIAVLFDVLEHISDARSICRSVYSMLKSGGIVLAATSPLYLSSHGHHLWDTPWGGPWAHLKPGYEPSDKSVSPYRLQNFLELGQCRHSDIKNWFEGVGFETVKERADRDQNHDISQHKSEFLPEFRDIPDEILMQIGSRFVFRKP